MLPTQLRVFPWASQYTLTKHDAFFFFLKTILTFVQSKIIIIITRNKSESWFQVLFASQPATSLPGNPVQSVTSSFTIRVRLQKVQFHELSLHSYRHVPGSKQPVFVSERRLTKPSAKLVPAWD